LGRVLLEQSEFDDALRHFEQGSRIMGESPGALAELGYCYARMGRHEEASRMGQQLRQMHERAYVSPLHRALIYTGLGQQDEAIAQLQQAFDNRIRQLVWVNVDPRFDSLRSNPEFARLVARLGLAPNATHRKPEQPLGAL
jgi:tetratricopeptide (TPR) repeat protein